jgi:hypothetical protein
LSILIETPRKLWDFFIYIFLRERVLDLWGFTVNLKLFRNGSEPIYKWASVRLKLALLCFCGKEKTHRFSQRKEEG